jgi:hypothetical protein
MARTFIRQDTQVRKSDVYADNVAPSLANYETNTVHIEDDLNSLRSQVQNILNRNGASFPSGNWWDDLTAPVTFENGTARGVKEVNQQLHDLERKRILRFRAVVGADVVVPTAVRATGTLTAGPTNFLNTETVTLGAKTYTFQTTLTNVDGNVQIGVDLQTSLANLKAAINLEAGAGTLYAAATTAHPTAEAVTSNATTLVARALLYGTGGNGIATTTTAAAAAWGGGTLSGGAGDIVILGAGELPGNTTAAVGNVTTLGTVVADGSSFFGTASLTEVAGGDALTPKNLVKIADAATGQVIVDGSGNEIHALLQSEFATDGTTITASTPNRVQLSFVVHNPTNDGLVLVDAQYIGGQTIDYSAVQRWALEDIPEHSWLSDMDFIDAGSGAVDLQDAYNNQGIVPVDLGTNATLDLEGAGFYWRIRDDLEATLFQVTEGSAGGTSTILFGSDVDVFDSSAVVNDFDQGIRVDTGGQRINVGETAGTIESTATNDLRLLGAGELYLDDGNQTGSTWAQTNGIKLSDTTAEWDAFETKFGGEVSLLSAIVSAANMGARGTKVYANVTATTAANNDVGGTGGGANLDAQLPNMVGGNFLTDYDVYVNGDLQRPGADLSANNDYYPGTSLTLGQLRFEYTVKVGDVICVVPYS